MSNRPRLRRRTWCRVVPGIRFSPDRLLQGRLFSYGDTQRYRLGINHHQIPVNAPRAPIANTFHRDGAMRTDGVNLGGRVNYEPNRFGEFRQDASVNEPPQAGGKAYRYDHREDEDYYSQPAALFALFDAAQRERFFGNIARHIHGVPNEIVARQIGHFRRIDPAYAQGVIDALAKLGQHIAQAVDQIEATSRNASRGVRGAMAFGIVAAAYGIVIASGVVGA